ncbi:MAG TPA: MFS transporter [Crocinitomix sp.]|nr:MFS transporter [Crocinitomix sp.]
MSKNYKTSFYTLTILFFLWGFTTVLNDILVPYFKSKFNLGDTASMLVQTTFFGAYGIGAFAYYIYSKYKTDLLNKIGYKNGILIGLLLSAIGTALFFPISYINNYYVYLLPLFVIGIGFTILQIACNPYVTLLGEQKSASSRLNLSQGINSLGTTLAPIIGAFLLFNSEDSSVTATDIGIPFLILSSIFLLTFVFVKFQNLPDYKNDAFINKVDVLTIPQVKLGMIAIFLYVGAEVAIGSKLLEYLTLENIMGFDKDIAGAYVGIYWGGAMIGRLSSAFLLNQELTLNKRVIYSALSTIATVVIITFAIQITTKLNFYDIYPILFFIPIQFMGLFIFRDSNQMTLGTFSGLNVILLLTAFIFKGEIAMWSIIAIGLFNSIMWSNIFTISIENLKENTSKASSLLIIMITGGAIFPLFMGIVSDKYNLEYAYLLPIIAYFYIFIFGIKSKSFKHKLSKQTE